MTKTQRCEKSSISIVFLKFYTMYRRIDCSRKEREDQTRQMCLVQYRNLIAKSKNFCAGAHHLTNSNCNILWEDYISGGRNDFSLVGQAFIERLGLPELCYFLVQPICMKVCVASLVTWLNFWRKLNTLEVCITTAVLPPFQFYSALLRIPPRPHRLKRYS